MAKKSLREDVKDIIIEVFKGYFFSKLKEQLEETVDKAHDAVIVTQKKLMRGLTAVAMFIVGLVFLVVGGTFLLTDVFNIDRTTVFLSIGVALLLISIILAQSARLLKYHFKT